MTKVNEYTISCYLDGSLPYEQACLVAEQISTDPAYRDTALELLKSHALLKSKGNDFLNEQVPDDLAKMIQSHPNKKDSFNRFLYPIFQTAAAVILLVTGFFTGQMGDSTVNNEIAMFPEIPASLATTVNKVLEYEKSGSIYAWEETNSLVTANVTPIKTFKDKSGNYYRYYIIDMKSADTNKRFAGLAHRVEKEQWQTKSFFTRDTPVTTTL